MYSNTVSIAVRKDTLKSKMIHLPEIKPSNEGIMDSFQDENSSSSNFMTKPVQDFI